MVKPAASKHFIWLDRAFWLLWILFPVYFWVSLSDVLNQPAEMAALAPDQAACLRDVPQIVNFSTAGQAAFWSYFAVHFAVYAALLGMAHRVIHSCAEGRMFVQPLIRTLWIIGVVITLYPVLDLLLANLTMAVYVATGDVKVFLPDFAFDVTVFGVGLLLVAIAMAMRQAMALQQDAELTI